MMILKTFPARTKFRKSQKMSRLFKRSTVDSLVFGEFGIQALETKRVNNKQIEALHFALVRYGKKVKSKSNAFLLRLFAHTPVTKKAQGVRMGTGKGEVDHYVALVKKNKIIIEFKDFRESEVKELYPKLQSKLGFKTTIISR